uniref:KRAB domain-containing protein n=1 Tax=Sciurus vulgaris TaxID=55149 RepID=A0A8D2ALE5_SCIVU
MSASGDLLPSSQGELVTVTFEDVAVYLSWRECNLLDETQKHLYHDVMLENLALVTCLGCWCEREDEETTSQQSVSAQRVSQIRSLKTHAAQKVPSCEICGPVLRDIFLLG